jgi:hypothetical protein
MKKEFVFTRSLVNRLIGLPMIILVLTIGSPSWAISYGFENITNNNILDAAIGEAQLYVDVLPVADEENMALFIFGNIGPELSSITDVYFDDGSILGIASIDNSDDGVAFSQYASPGNLPGANNASPPFETTAGFSADSDSPAQPNGVNPYETLGIYFDLKYQQTYENVILDLASGVLRIGIHVQGFESGGSEGFINGEPGFPPDEYDNPPPLPEPATMFGAFLATGTLAGYIRKRRNVL